MIKIDKISKKFDKKKVFDKISFDINDNEKLLIIGPSGCGKTTMIRCINGLEKIDSGNIYLNNVNTKDMDKVYLKNKIGMVFQNYNLFPHLTVGENITLAPIKLKKLSVSAANKKMMSLLKMINLSNKKDSSFVFITYTKHVGYAYISMRNACFVGCCEGRRPPLRVVYSRTSSRSSGTTMRPLKCCAASRVYVSRRVASVFSSV